MTIRRHRLALFVLPLFAGCGSDPGPDNDSNLVDGVFTEAEWQTVQALSPLPEKPPPDPTNQVADDPGAAKLGQRLFFEKSYAGPLITGSDGMNGGLGQVGEKGKIACASCHEGPWMIDLHSRPNATALGADWTSRNAGSPINASFYAGWYENDGLRDSQWSDSLTDPEYPASQNSSRLRVAHVIYEKYRDDYNAVFEPDLDPDLDPASPNAARFPAEGKPGDAAYDRMTPQDQAVIKAIFANYGKSIQAYLRRLVSTDAAFDRYVAGDHGELTAQQKRGLKLFVGKAGCVLCHNTPLFSDTGFHNIGLAAAGEHVIAEEDGRFFALGDELNGEFNVDSAFSDDRTTKRLDGLMPAETDKGKWRTHGLRQAAQTGPYMHTGQFATLNEVVEFYNQGGSPDGFIGEKDPAIKPLGLTPDEVLDVAAFLEALTGALVAPELQTDTSAP